MNPPRLIALDLDGTLLGTDAKLSERSRRAVRRCVAAGAQVVICTGRPPRMTHAFAEALGLETSIVYNGATRLDHVAGTRVDHHQLSGAAAREIITRLRAAFPGIGLGLETAAGWYLDAAPFEAARERLAAAGHPPPDGVGAIEDFLEQGAIKIFGRHPEHSVQKLAAAIADLAVYVTWSGPGLLEVMHRDVNKRDALERLSEQRGIGRAEVAAFGDNHNDVQMLAWAGHGVAVANASAEAQAAADEIAADHAAHGVAAVLERWFP